MFKISSIKKQTSVLMLSIVSLITACNAVPDHHNKQTIEKDNQKTQNVQAGFSTETLSVGHGNEVPRYFTLDEKGRAALKNHDQAVNIFTPKFFLRDPYIMLGPDNYYYLTNTRLANILGGGKYDYLNEGVEIWRSKNLADWELLGVPVRLKQLSNLDAMLEKLKNKQHNNGKPLLWAPELHYIDNKWYITHTSNAQQAVLWVADDVMGPYKEAISASKFGHRHDPTLYQNHDGKNYLLYRAIEAVEMTENWDDFIGKPWKINPADRKIGHEGTYVIKIDDTYVIFGTAWSTDKMRHGSYNLYYVTAKSIKGPYSKRKWVGRFLGHGTPFQDKQGRWWITAFTNGKYVPFKQLMQQSRQDDKAYTMTPTGAMLVPVEIYKDANGEVKFNVKDNRFKYPGPEEVQQFSIE
ncbi:family 43 glycosylhydrolase [Catenovulum adriaticum]|uniref:Family 43 glycosylhydrolase n=1 Tax=Catenovulum adriaticum TaxID=2984846 RepID=A0ABY7AQL0_9ALTE|nr:family 43 glycosylhydrolase [Catenovulum sp. TS8]WAJ71769.1 family 43 glycosylhydrolase [Catenovulum sp. TS8]